MNIYELLLGVHSELSVILDIVHAYEELKPDWDKIDQAINYYAVDINGDHYVSEDELFFNGYTWASDGAICIGNLGIPYGVDSRLCKWHRPEAA